ncbi:MAG TPA: hypothetical protein VHQ65_10270 [Thermoanaerobaculia bacterium]|nr:hypothetical protein [Thermoanaerobaculia bacterium]
MLDELRGEGFALYLLLDGSGDGLEQALERRGEVPPTALTVPRRALPPAPPEAQGEPVFRINGRDLAFLRSVGIDPTRTLRRRRPAREGDPR